LFELKSIIEEGVADETAGSEGTESMMALKGKKQSGKGAPLLLKGQPGKDGPRRPALQFTKPVWQTTEEDFGKRGLVSHIN